MLPCGLCEVKFSSKDDLREHLERHASKLFDSKEEFHTNKIKSERHSDPDSDVESLIFEYVKEEQLQDQQEEIKDEGSEGSTSFSPSEAIHASNDDLKEELNGHASHLFDSNEAWRDKEIKIERDSDPESDEGSLVLDCVKEEEQLQDQQKETQAGKSEFPSGTFMCSMCSFKTINQYNFKVHTKVMHLNKYKCDHCPKRFSIEGHLTNHIEKKHENEVKAKLPEDEFFRITKQQDKRNRKLFECLECSYKTSDRSHIYRHIRTVHRKLLDERYKSKGMALDDAGYQKCPKCFFKTLRTDHLRKHIKRIHQKTQDLTIEGPIKERLTCDLCQTTTKHRKYMLNHMKRKHLKREG